MKKIAQQLFNSVIDLFKNHTVRYKFFLPLVQGIGKNYDEEILESAMRFVAHSNVEGDYLEFGVWKGRSFSKAWHMRRYVRSHKLKNMHFYAFDSFEGLPEIKNPHDASTGEFKKGDYACDVDTFRHILRKNGVNIDDVTIVPGWYSDTLNGKTKNNLPIKKAAIIFIDCDLYESTVPVLNFITDYVADGTIIIFDDWFAFRGHPDKGEQRAFREWLNRNPNIRATEWQKVNWKTNSFIINRDANMRI